MPKLPKAFARRKSAANVLDEPLADVPPNQQSFRVFDRANTTNFDGGKPRLNGGSGNVSGRPSTTDPERDDNMFSGFSNRGSGTSNSNTVSTADNSSRRSAVSSASSDPNAQPENNTNGKNANAPLPAVPKGTAKFSLKSTGKAFSFGRKHSAASTPSTTQEDLSKPPTPAKDDTTRSSTLTDSARSDYSSTNASLKLENRLSLGGDFAAMFMNTGNNRKSAVLDAENRRTQSVSPAEGSTSTARQSGVSRKPLGNVSNERSLAGDTSSYPWGVQKSAEKQRLMFGTSPGPSPTGTPPPVPEHDTNGSNNTNRPGVGLRRSSAVRRQSLMAIGDGEDEDAKLMRESINAMRQLNVDETPRARDSWINPSAVAAYNVAHTPKPTAPSSNNTTPRARYPATEPQEDSLFDQQTAASANLALQWGEKPSTPQSSAPKTKVMTTAQFERYRQDQERAKRYSNGKFPDANPDDDDDAADDTYEDEDDDEEERRKEQAKQRRKQEAHMTVYRQQMMKITGEAPNPIARPSAVTSQSTPNLQLYADNPNADEEEDEDIPLAILAAHGFPNRSRAPGQLNGMSSNPNLRASSQLSGAYPPPPRSVTGGAGDRASALPAFARRLPQDPYFGAGLVNSTNRESLALGSGSQYGGTGGGPRAQPGGLVGVIASEERSRALRRGSPNPAGEYPAMPPGLGLGYAGGARAPGAMPQDPAAMQAQIAAMQAQLQQSMEMQFQFFQMMAGAAPPMQAPPGVQMVPGMMPQGMMPPPQGMPAQGAPQLGGMGRTSTMGSSFGFGGAFPAGPRSVAGTQQRPVTMLDSRGYAASIAPSERSNVGMPDRYRPVSHMPAAESGGVVAGPRMSVLAKGPAVTVRPVEGEEDEEDAWEEMRRQKEKKKSMWRMKREKKGVLVEEVGEMARFTS
ncbi:hypothetical protein VE03_00369 [Pseudogymnoascus sp. 23342-1-I1]|nr:hypothetical protein VE03_00369 [Pseudogymnoascus sp. 23342-1-I1]